MGRWWIALGAVAGAGAVAMAAVTAHGAPQTLDPSAREALRSAVQIQGWHALALVATGLWALHARALSRLLAGMAACGFILGTALFSFSIYAHHLLGLSTGPLAPVGGTLLMLAWLTLAASSLAPGARA